jgi:hypothetical protein
MLAYAKKITASPSSMTLQDLNGLREHFSEEQTLDIVVIAKPVQLYRSNCRWPRS